MSNPPLWKASVALAKDDAPNVAALFELTPPRAQAVLIAEEPFENRATVEALYGVMPDGELLSRLAGREVHVALLPDVGRAELVDFFVTREREATFRPSPGSAALRAGERTRAPGLYLAGAWTDTGWPATMEGAVRSGDAAAAAVLGQHVRQGVAA